MWARCRTSGSAAPAVVVEEVLAFGRGEADTGHGSAHRGIGRHRLAYAGLGRSWKYVPPPSGSPEGSWIDSAATGDVMSDVGRPIALPYTGDHRRIVLRGGRICRRGRNRVLEVRRPVKPSPPPEPESRSPESVHPTGQSC